MRRWVYIVGAILFLLQFTTPCAGKAVKGYLLIIGGGQRPQRALEKFVRLCQGKPILVITSASSVPQEAGENGVKQFKAHGAEQVSWLHIDTPEIANADSTVARISRCGGIYFSGGVQQTLMQRIRGTRAETAIKKIYHEGGIIGGTSAGAAVMSRVMITGNELVAKDSSNAFATIQAGNIETETGLGFLEDVIIDQHFVKRKRNNRLISCVLEHPKLLGIGIDESTAILVYPDRHFEVFGESTVLIYDARKASGISKDQKGLLRGRAIKMHVLTEGDLFKLP